MTIPRKSGLLLLGSPTSGISALGGCLRVLGVNLGERLGGQKCCDEFINQEIAGIHDMLLSDLGYRWEMIGDLPADWLRSSSAARTKRFVKAIIEREFQDSRQWAICDHRLCRLMPMWNEIFNELQIDPGIVFLSRHPREVCFSLKEKCDMTSRHALLLWLAHHKDALDACRNHNHCILTFDQLLADPIESLSKISQNLHFDYPLSLREYSRDILAFLRREEKSHHTSIEDSEINERNFRFYEWFYNQLRLRLLQPSTPDNPFTSKQIISGSTISAGETLEESTILPLLSSTSGSTISGENAKAVSALFNDLMQTISSFERLENDNQTKMHRLLLSNGSLGEAFLCRLRFSNEKSHLDTPSFNDGSSKLIPSDHWYRVSFPISQPERLRSENLTLQISNQTAMVSVGSLSLVSSASGNTVWTANAKNHFRDCRVSGDAVELSRGDHLSIMATGNFPLLLFPELANLTYSPLELIIWIKLKKSLSDFKTIRSNDLSSIENLKESLRMMKLELDSAREESATILQANKDLDAKWTKAESLWEADRVKLLQQLSEKSKIIQMLETELKQAKAKLLSVKANLRSILEQPHSP